MTPIAFPRSLAILLLRFAVWIAPHDTLDWGRGMLSELHHVEGNWSALIWAVGGAGVLAKHAMLALILPGSHRRTVSSASELFAKEIPMRKATLTATAACVVASLLFFLVPVFRQAFQVSLAQWHDILHINQRWQGRGSDPELEALGKKAEQNHDAESLVFVAVRHSDPSESVRLAEEAVRLEPNLTWVYGVIAAQYSSFPQVDRWVSDLKKYDPQNALPYFIVAENIDIDEVVHETSRPALGKGIMSGRENHESPAWQSAMAAAFRSQKLDSYRDRLVDLDRGVLSRYHIRDPFEAINDRWFYSLTSYSSWDSSRYAKSLLESGQTLEAKGDFAGAAEKYLEVARFGQMLQPEGGFFFLGRDTSEASRRLAALSLRKGDKSQAAFYASLADQIQKTDERELSRRRSEEFGGDLTRWNALIARASGFTLLFCALLLLTCTLGILVRGGSVKPRSFVTSPLTLAVCFSSALGALLSSVMLYVTYRPYSQILQRFTVSGDKGQIPELGRYLEEMQLPIGARGYIDATDAAFHFWCVVTVLCVLAILFAFLIHFRQRRPASASV
ncbi:MAG: hypothetical protein WA817_07620 [Candidatus Acidiferrum sp.]